MILVGLFIIILFFISVIWRRKNIYLLEFFAIWFFLATISQNLTDIAMANLELFKVTKKIEMFWASFLNRFLLIPLILILFVDFYSVSKSFIGKVLLFVACVLILTIVDQAASWLGIIKFQHWEIWWSLLGWACIFLAALGCRKILQYLLRKGNEIT